MQSYFGYIKSIEIELFLSQYKWFYPKRITSYFTDEIQERLYEKKHNHQKLSIMRLMIAKGKNQKLKVVGKHFMLKPKDYLNAVSRKIKLDENIYRRFSKK